MTKLKTICRTLTEEFKRERCGCDHSPPDDFFKSQWQNCTKSTAYFIYRWIIALFFTAVVIESMINSIDSTNFWLYFIYLTNWGILLCMITNCLGAVLVSIWHYHPDYADKLLNMQSISSPFRVYWILHEIVLVLSLVITTIYWSVLYDATEDGLDATNIMTHALNSIIMFIDLLIVAHPLRLLHMGFPLLFGLIYTAFSIIYQKSGGLNKKGQAYIYNVLNWDHWDTAVLTVLGVVLLTCCIYMLVFLIYKLRIAIYKYLTKTTFFLPTSTSKTENNGAKNDGNTEKECSSESGVQHSPSGISMVLGNYEGYRNKAFNSSRENIVY